MQSLQHCQLPCINDHQSDLWVIKMLDLKLETLRSQARKETWSSRLMVCFIIESSKSLQMLKRPHSSGLCSWRGHTWYQMKVSLQVAWIARRPWWHVCWVVLNSRVLIVDFAPQISKHSKSIVELQEALSQVVQISDRKTQSHIQQDGWLAVPKQTFHRDTVNRCLLAFKTQSHCTHWMGSINFIGRSWWSVFNAHDTRRIFFQKTWVKGKGLAPPLQVSTTIVLRWTTERRLSTLREELHVRHPVFAAAVGKGQGV